MMSNFSDKELAILLAYYLRDKKRHTSHSKFLRQFELKFSKELNNEVLDYALAIYKSIDPQFSSINPTADKDFIKAWKYYITEKRDDELNKLYKDFIADSSEYRISHTSFYDNKTLAYEFPYLKATIVFDSPKEKYAALSESTSEYNRRDPQVIINALAAAHYLCEIDNSHFTFIRKNCELPYTEGHHLIPLKFQERFNVNLDIEANVVSLCSSCHNLLHYGKDYEELLKVLYKMRKERLLKCGIDISFDELKSFYD